MGGVWGGGGGLGAVIIGCVVYGIELGWGCVVNGLVCLTSSGFSSGLLFSVGVFWSQISIVFVCVCLRVCVCVCVRSLAPSHVHTQTQQSRREPRRRRTY